MDDNIPKSKLSLQARHRKLVLKIEYLEAEWEEAQEYMRLAQREFTQCYAKCLNTYSPDIITSVNTKTQNSTPPPEPTIQKVESDEKEVKKLFRQVAGETHPDKMAHMNEEEQEIREGLFIKAKKACEDLNWYELSKLAEELKISIPTLSESHIAMLENSAGLLQQKIDRFKQTAAWQWRQIMPTEKREEFMHTYIKTFM